MSAITKALQEIRFSIPDAVLRAAFIGQYQWRGIPQSLDDAIMQKVLGPRVMVDCNLVGGAFAMIPLGNVPMQYVDPYSLIYHIPKELTQGRTILSALSVSYMPASGAWSDGTSSYGLTNMGNVSNLASAMQRVSDSVSNLPPISNAYVDLIGENTILIRNQARITQSYILRCILNNDENLNNISPRSWPAFAKLCVLAVKAYIYNELLIRMDQTYLEGGQELGTFKNYVDTLSDSNEMYLTHLREVWMVTATMNDVHAHTRLIKLMVNPAV